MPQDKNNHSYVICKNCGIKFYVIVPNHKVVTTSEGYLMINSKVIFPLIYVCTKCEHQMEYSQGKILLGE
jgi:DNA-directed RNA polymerase subunit RPC12/RpoP